MVLQIEYKFADRRARRKYVETIECQSNFTLRILHQSLLKKTPTQ
jgi:hypothetical protein